MSQYDLSPGQTVPHFPQLKGSLFVSTHALPPGGAPPSGIAPPSMGGGIPRGQTVSPISQTSAHFPIEHDSAPAHFLLQSPQFCGSFWTSMQALPHRLVPPEHDGPHAPFWQTSPPWV